VIHFRPFFRKAGTGLLLSLLFISVEAQKRVKERQLSTDVLVIGGGTGGTAAGIQSARMGVPTLIAEPTPWLGGMLSAAGVTATDGNHRLPSGIWEEFRQHLYKVYGGPAQVETGWVSNTLFEPHVADSIFKVMAKAEKMLSVHHGLIFRKALVENGRLVGALFSDQKKNPVRITAKVVIDATELGDVLADAGVPYDVGMEADSETGEGVGVPETNDIIQELTYAAILKDYGKGVDKTIPRPAGYDPKEFDCCCTSYCFDSTLEKPSVDAETMLNYGKLPRNKYMINWPKRGNDTYLNIIHLSEEERAVELEKAKQMTYRFIYFIQNELGFRNLGLADDEFPTADRMPLIPYHREGRRMKGVVRFSMKNISEPFTWGDPLYRTGISVGDYPIDHHHKKNRNAPQHLEFYPVPSFNVPMGSLIPEKMNGLVVAEKGISVSNVVNGTTRLQPCVLLTGQAAGMIAALSVLSNVEPRELSVRTVQQELLEKKVMIMPYIDVPPTDPDFMAIQRIGATGIIRGTGVPYRWANQTWFYPDQPISGYELVQGLKWYYPQYQKYLEASGEFLDLNSLIRMLQVVDNNIGVGEERSSSRKLTRREVAVLLDKWLNPFTREITFQGYLQ